MEKQTAVEWLYDQLMTKTITDYVAVLEQAKELERQQIVEAYEQGQAKEAFWTKGNDYYNQTFKQ